MNSVFLSGNICRGPEAKTDKLAVATLAVNSFYSKKKETCFIECTFFGEPAKWLVADVQKGDPIMVAGRLVTNSWESNGKKNSRTVVYCNEWKRLTRKNEMETRPDAEVSDAPSEDFSSGSTRIDGETGEEIPF